MKKMKGNTDYSIAIEDIIRRDFTVLLNKSPKIISFDEFSELYGNCNFTKVELVPIYTLRQDKLIDPLHNSHTKMKFYSGQIRDAYMLYPNPFHLLANNIPLSETEKLMNRCKTDPCRVGLHNFLFILNNSSEYLKPDVLSKHLEELLFLYETHQDSIIKYGLPLEPPPKNLPIFIYRLLSFFPTHYYPQYSGNKENPIFKEPDYYEELKQSPWINNRSLNQFIKARTGLYAYKVNIFKGLIKLLKSGDNIDYDKLLFSIKDFQETNHLAKLNHLTKDFPPHFRRNMIENPPRYILGGMQDINNAVNHIKSLLHNDFYELLAPLRNTNGILSYNYFNNEKHYKYAYIDKLSSIGLIESYIRDISANNKIVIPDKIILEKNKLITNKEISKIIRKNRNQTIDYNKITLVYELQYQEHEEYMKYIRKIEDLFIIYNDKIVSMVDSFNNKKYTLLKYMIMLGGRFPKLKIKEKFEKEINNLIKTVEIKNSKEVQKHINNLKKKNIGTTSKIYTKEDLLDDYIKIIVKEYESYLPLPRDLSKQIKLMRENKRPESEIKDLLSNHGCRKQRDSSLIRHYKSSIDTVFKAFCSSKESVFYTKDGIHHLKVKNRFDYYPYSKRTKYIFKA